MIKRKSKVWPFEPKQSAQKLADKRFSDTGDRLELGATVDNPTRFRYFDLTSEVSPRDDADRLQNGLGPDVQPQPQQEGETNEG